MSSAGVSNIGSYLPMCFLGVELVMVAIAVEVARVPSSQTPKLPMFGG